MSIIYLVIIFLTVAPWLAGTTIINCLHLFKTIPGVETKYIIGKSCIVHTFQCVAAGLPFSDIPFCTVYIMQIGRIQQSLTEPRPFFVF